LRPGDVVHIPRSTPHQVLVKPGSSVVYVVVKIPHVP
jgi:quercetin dioxygenase-like cupin family protein